MLRSIFGRPLTVGKAAVALGLVGAVGVGGLAVASIPGPGGRIKACARKTAPRKGVLRVIDSAARCRKTERTLTWNQAAPNGSPGAPGAQGGQGAQGAQGIQGVQGQTGAEGPSEVEYLGHTKLTGKDQLFTPSGKANAVDSGPGKEVTIAALAPSAFVAQNLHVKLSVAPGAGDKRTFEFVVDGVPQSGGPTCVIADTATSCSSASGQQVSVPAGATLALTSLKAGSATDPAGSEAMYGWSASPS
jgi:hypothetical protein